jgi:hypothetical protein
MRQGVMGWMVELRCTRKNGWMGWIYGIDESMG